MKKEKMDATALKSQSDKTHKEIEAILDELVASTGMTRQELAKKLLDPAQTNPEILESTYKKYQGLIGELDLNIDFKESLEKLANPAPRKKPKSASGHKKWIPVK